MTASPSPKITIRELITITERAQDQLGYGAGRAALGCLVYELKELAKRKRVSKARREKNRK